MNVENVDIVQAQLHINLKKKTEVIRQCLLFSSRSLNLHFQTEIEIKLGFIATHSLPERSSSLLTLCSYVRDGWADGVMVISELNLLYPLLCKCPWKRLRLHHFSLQL